MSLEAKCEFKAAFGVFKIHSEEGYDAPYKTDN
jgi:hypothetical protein